MFGLAQKYDKNKSYIKAINRDCGIYARATKIYI